jgi:hypothetical protein
VVFSARKNSFDVGIKDQIAETQDKAIADCEAVLTGAQ